MFKLIVIALFISPFFVNAEDVAWEDCGTADRSLIFRKVGLKSPLVVDSKQPIQMQFSFDVLDQFDQEVQMSVDLRRYFSILGITSSVPIPCINDVGSCSGPFCYFVQSYANLARSVSEQLHVPFNCELTPGHVEGNVTYAVPIDTFKRIPSILLSAVSGTYELVIRWTSKDHELGCVAIRTPIDIRS